MDVLDFPTNAPGFGACVHTRTDVGDFQLELCPRTDEATWLRRGSEVDPAVAMAALFGQFDLCGVLPATAAPGERAFAYRPNGRRGRSAMRALPLRRWFEAAPDLWLGHDGEMLLLAPSDPILAANLARNL